MYSGLEGFFGVVEALRLHSSVQALAISVMRVPRFSQRSHRIRVQ